MPTVIEINNPEATYCEKHDIHCLCPKCEFYGDCYQFKVEECEDDNRLVRDLTKKCCDTCSVYDYEREEAIDDILKCSNQESYREMVENGTYTNIEDL